MVRELRHGLVQILGDVIEKILSVVLPRKVSDHLINLAKNKLAAEVDGVESEELVGEDTRSR